MGFGEGQLVAGQGTDLTKPFSHDAGDAADRCGSFVSRLPFSIDGIAKVETLDGVGEVAHEIAAAKFAISENFEAQFFLFGENAPDVLVLELAEALGIGAGLAGLEQIGRPEQTAYLVSAKGVRHDDFDLSPDLDPASGAMTLLALPRLRILESGCAWPLATICRSPQCDLLWRTARCCSNRWSHFETLFHAME
jgi:hypothetical protein